MGTERRPILVSGEKQFFVAPDNGVLSMIYERESCTVRHITAEHYFLNPVSPTFHGRDIFAPTAAWLSKAFQTEAFGEVITDFVRFTMPKAKASGQAVKGVVLRVDAFGNLMTNLTAEDIPIGALDGGRDQAGREWQAGAEVCANVRFWESGRADRRAGLGGLRGNCREPRQRRAHAWSEPRR